MKDLFSFSFHKDFMLAVVDLIVVIDDIDDK